VLPGIREFIEAENLLPSSSYLKLISQSHSGELYSKNWYRQQVGGTDLLHCWIWWVTT